MPAAFFFAALERLAPPERVPAAVRFAPVDRLAAGRALRAAVRFLAGALRTGRLLAVVLRAPPRVLFAAEVRVEARLADFLAVFFAGCRAVVLRTDRFAAFLAVDFLAGDFLAADFFVADFFVADFLVADFFATDFLAADFFLAAMLASAREETARYPRLM